MGIKIHKEKGDLIMKKTLTIKTDIMQVQVSVNGTTATLEQINPVMIFSNKHYVLHMEKLNIAGDTFAFDIKNSFEIPSYYTEEDIILSITESIYKERGKLFLYSIKDASGNYTSQHQLKIFKAIGTPTEEYSISYANRSFVINENCNELEQINIDYDIPVKLSLTGYMLDKEATEYIHVTERGIYLKRQKFNTVEDAQKYAVDQILTKLSLVKKETVRVEVPKRKVVKNKKRGPYVKIDTPEFAAVAEKYEKGLITSKQAGRKFGIAQNTFLNKMAQYRKLTSVK